MELVDLFIWIMFGLAIVSTIVSIVIIRKHPEVLDEKHRLNKKTEDWKIHYWSWPPM